MSGEYRIRVAYDAAGAYWRRWSWSVLTPVMVEHHGRTLTRVGAHFAAKKRCQADARLTREPDVFIYRSGEDW